MSLTPEQAAVLPAVQAVADASGNDQKFVVQVYLIGGMDCHKFMRPTGAGPYAAYAAVRGALIDPNDGTNDLTGQGAALHPAMPKLAAKFNAGKAGILCNVGTMVTPLTKTEINNLSNPALLPKVLFSHYDQQNEWQSGLPQTQGAPTGWGGRLMDLIDAAYNLDETVPATISVSGLNLFMTGHNARQFQVGAGAAGTFETSLFTKATNFIKSVSASSAGTNSLENAMATVVSRGHNTGVLINAAISSIDISGFPNTGIGQQLKMVARLIAAASALGHRRGLYYVTLGSFDTHNTEEPSLTNLLTQLDNAVDAFHEATKTLGAGGTSLENNCLLFTGSDFGRCLVPNNSGSDHGWGGHNFFIGGSVVGGHIYRKVSPHDATVTLDSMPDITLDGPHDVGQGRLIPSTSVDEYGATIAEWFGLPQGPAMNLVFPNLPNMPMSNLGFLGAGGGGGGGIDLPGSIIIDEGWSGAPGAGLNNRIPDTVAGGQWKGIYVPGDSDVDGAGHWLSETFSSIRTIYIYDGNYVPVAVRNIAKLNGSGSSLWVGLGTSIDNFGDGYVVRFQADSVVAVKGDGAGGETILHTELFTDLADGEYHELDLITEPETLVVMVMVDGVELFTFTMIDPPHAYAPQVLLGPTGVTIDRTIISDMR